MLVANRAVRSQADDRGNLCWPGLMISREGGFCYSPKAFQFMQEHAISCFQSCQESGGFASSVQCLLKKAVPAGRANRMQLKA